MKVLAAFFLAAAGYAQAGTMEGNKRMHSHLLGKAHARHEGNSETLDALHSRVQKKYKDHMEGVQPEPPKKKRKARNKMPEVEMVEHGRILKKSKKSSKSSSSSSGSSSSSSSSSSNEIFICEVRVTNLHPFQILQDFFVLIHSDKLDYPLYEFGVPAVRNDLTSSGDIDETDNGLKELAEDGDTKDLEDFYEDEEGVYDLGVIPGPLPPGFGASFLIEFTDTYDEISVISSVLFSNDAFIGVSEVPISDDIDTFFQVLDAGVEPNIATCWSVKAEQNDFPTRSECRREDDNDANDNENDLGPGEGFVHIHRGMHNLLDEDDVENFLDLFDCEENGADDFGEYFDILGYDDVLGNIQDDAFFIDFVRAGDYDDDLVELAGESSSFNDFCLEVERLIDDIKDDLDDSDDRLEAEIFGWRQFFVQLEVECENESSYSDSLDGDDEDTDEDTTDDAP